MPIFARRCRTRSPQPRLPSWGGAEGAGAGSPAGTRRGGGWGFLSRAGWLWLRCSLNLLPAGSKHTARWTSCRPRQLQIPAPAPGPSFFLPPKKPRSRLPNFCSPPLPTPPSGGGSAPGPPLPSGAAPSAAGPCPARRGMCCLICRTRSAAALSSLLGLPPVAPAPERRAAGGAGEPALQWLFECSCQTAPTGRAPWWSQGQPPGGPS